MDSCYSDVSSYVIAGHWPPTSWPQASHQLNPALWLIISNGRQARRQVFRSRGVQVEYLSLHPSKDLGYAQIPCWRLGGPDSWTPPPASAPDGKQRKSTESIQAKSIHSALTASQSHARLLSSLHYTLILILLLLLLSLSQSHHYCAIQTHTTDTTGRIQRSSNS